MAENQPRIVLLGNVSPVDSLRTVEQLADVDVDELRDDPEVRSVVVDEDQGVVGVHRRVALDGASVTRAVIPADMGLVEGVATVLRVYESDHSDDAPEWVWSEDDEGVAAAIADHYTRAGHECEVGVPDSWARKTSLPEAAKMLLRAATGDVDDDDPADGLPVRRIGGGSPELDRFMELNGLTVEQVFGIGRVENLRTAAGRDFQSRVMGDTASTGTGSYAAASWIGLTENATAPADTDTTLTGELSAFGLGRAQAVYAHTAGASTYTLTKTFTSTDATTRTPAKIGVFNAASAGTMPFTTLVPSPPALVSGDSLTLTETVSI